MSTTIPRIPDRLRPGATRRRLAAAEARLDTLNTGLLRAFEAAGRPVPAELATTDRQRRIAVSGLVLLQGGRV